ncbi:uncharacterized protein CTRU02_210241 [Colletotrichum truncatum]|uniref:Uncharacterized protein n=1 Tax=Colletotrichum truncatum TaxID=5467 RepID=A0ACC3YUP0_COLTU|nr:uncharacterized protein CTRU02_11451 [Colletotrichum truncatum]KAF6785826.1 hypothetical protein CTRU02_11451 [Colletotrichum truncatum]
MEPTTETRHILFLAREHENAITIVLSKPKGCAVPLYNVNHNPKCSKMEIRRIKCDSVSTEHRPIGAVKLRTIPHRVDVTVRGVSFKLSRKHPLSSTLGFRFLGAGEMRWEKIDKKSRGMKLVDFNGKTQAFFHPRMHVVNHPAGNEGGGEIGDKSGRRSSPGTKAGWGPGFELLATRLADLDMDLIVTTGLAAAEYRRQLDEDWDDFVQDGHGNMRDNSG